LANFITIIRLLLLFTIFVILDYGGLNGHILALFLTIILITLDAVDGIVARWLKETSEFGSVLDIVVDRIVENCFWIYFAARGIIPVWIPFLIISRGFLTDGIRSIALSKGMTAFGEKSLQKSALGKAVVSSRFSRGLYGFSKILAFLSLITLQALSFPESESIVSDGIRGKVIVSSYVVIYFTVIYCIIRGIPVLLDSRSFLSKVKN